MALNIFPVEFNSADIVERIRRDLEPRGEGIRRADYLIVGIFLSRNAILMTRNRSYFERAPDLHLAALGDDHVTG